MGILTVADFALSKIEGNLALKKPWNRVEQSKLALYDFNQEGAINRL